MTISGDYEPSPSEWVRNQVAAYEASGGREANTLLETGLPIVIVTMVGNKSGKVRKIALMRVEHDGDYALVGSKGGAPEHPVWVYNLRADPSNVTIQDGETPISVTLRELDEGAEYDAWWTRAVAAYPPYAEYKEKTSRTIPVFVATPS
jgi:F420H(2)-dependent quinone reductase